MSQNYEYHFEFKPGKFIFVPTDHCLENGAQIVDDLKQYWSPNQIFYHFGKRGGHVAAMRLHLNHRYFASVDLTQFFTNVTRTKVVRALQSVGFASQMAFDTAYSSVVEQNGRKFLPYGFPQSMALATLAVEKSALGSCLMELNADAELLVSMYVDDIIISSNNLPKLETAFDAIIESARRARFAVNDQKSSHPTQRITAFNCEIEHNKMTINDDRMGQFRADYWAGSDFTQEAIARYVGVVNEAQLEDLQ